MAGVSSLQEFNQSIKKQYTDAHGKDYCKYCNDLQDLMKECESYKELGVNQGAAVSSILLTNPTPKRVHCVDNNMSNFNENRDLFESYAKEHNIELVVQECDSKSEECVSEVDMLFIDSFHYAHHLREELLAHGSKVKKYIIAHDTADRVREGASLHKELMSYCEKFPEWRLYKRCQISQGYTIIKRNIT